MVDYHLHIAALDHLRAAAPSSFSSDPDLASAIDALISAAGTDPDAAALGACIDHVLAQSTSDGTELELLAKAADLWSRGLTIYDQFSGARSSIENALQNPSDPGAVAAFQSAVTSLDTMRGTLQQFVSEAQAVKAAIQPMHHLKEHPRQTDTDLKDWDFGNLFCARRTDAFVRAAFRAADTESEKAFAFGVLSSYAANVAGSAYLAQVVGGPRRSHRFRDRLARNTVGSRIRALSGTPSTPKLSAQLNYKGLSGAVAFPFDLGNVAMAALHMAFPSRTLPDLDVGLHRVVEQLRLLDVFNRPDLPDPPPLALSMASDPTGILTIMSGDLEPPSVGVSLDPDMTPHTPGQADSSKSAGGTCLAFLIALLTLGIALLIYCIGKWSTDKKCKVSDFFDEFQGSGEPDPRAPTGTTQSQLTSMSAPDAAAHITQELYSVHCVFWQAFDLAYSYLAVAGLIYPDDLLMPSPLYSQFATTPNRTAWPHRPEPQPEDTYHLDPSAAIEYAAADAPPFTPFSDPMALFIADRRQSIHPVAKRLLLQVLRGEQDSENYDLDADRGFLHPCWECAPGTSISDVTLSVSVLPYAAD